MNIEAELAADVRRGCHDLRNCLASILAFAELLADETQGPLTEGQREQVEVVLSSVLRATGVVREVHARARQSV